MTPTFRYSAKNWEGKTTEGTHAAKSLREALDYLRAQNLFVLNIKEQGEPQERRSLSSQFTLGKKKPKSRDFMVFCRQFATMIQAGITVLQILKVQAAQAEHPGLQDRLRDVALVVEKGGTLSDAFKGCKDFFPQIVITMVEAGETGGILDDTMERLGDHFQRQHDMEEKIRSATTYPVIITIVIFLVMLLMVLFVLPQFGRIFEEAGFQMPLITRILLGMSHFLLRFWYLVLALLIILTVGVRRYMRTERGRERFDRFFLGVPVFGPIYTKMVVARFSRTLGTLLASGVQLLSSLELVERVINNVIYARALEQTRQVIRQGQAMALPLAASGLFPPMLVEMVHVGEETGALDGMLSRTADFYEQEVTFILDRLGTIIETILIIFIGLFVGLLLVSIVTPMFQIYEMI